MSSTHIAVPIVSAPPSLRVQIAQARRAGANLIELRVDLIGDVPAVEALLHEGNNRDLIVTIRAAAEGGAWQGSEEQRLAAIARLAALGPGYVDVEYATWTRLPDARARV